MATVTYYTDCPCCAVESSSTEISSISSTLESSSSSVINSSSSSSDEHCYYYYSAYWDCSSGTPHWTVRETPGIARCGSPLLDGFALNEWNIRGCEAFYWATSPNDCPCSIGDTAPTPDPASPAGGPTAEDCCDSSSASSSSSLSSSSLSSSSTSSSSPSSASSSSSSQSSASSFSSNSPDGITSGDPWFVSSESSVSIGSSSSDCECVLTGYNGGPLAIDNGLEPPLNVCSYVMPGDCLPCCLKLPNLGVYNGDDDVPYGGSGEGGATAHLGYRSSSGYPGGVWAGLDTHGVGGAYHYAVISLVSQCAEWEWSDETSTYILITPAQTYWQLDVNAFPAGATGTWYLPFDPAGGLASPVGTYGEIFAGSGGGIATAVGVTLCS